MNNHKRHEQIVKDQYRLYASWIAPYFVKLKVKANVITISRIIFVIIPSFLIAFDKLSTIPSLLTCSISLFLFSFLDALDGEVAKKSRTSVLGKWLDPQIDRIGITILITSIIINLLSNNNSNLAIILLVIGININWINSNNLGDMLYKPKYQEFRDLRSTPSSKTFQAKTSKKRKNYLKYILKFISLNSYMHIHNICLLLIICICFINIEVFTYLFFIRVLISYIKDLYTSINKIRQIN